ncbi:MAG: S-methyl-5-thioribose-1-phosphate isomerase [Ignavibacteriae bacterium]|nr:S-methyl-5-thioribose-1-phosphate isomerase [Ignavibacteriota bacterium]
MQAIRWDVDVVKFIDQTKLPFEEYYIRTVNYTTIVDAIISLQIRGAPLIGIAATYAVALAAKRLHQADLPTFKSELKKVINKLKATRPTAVNLFTCLEKMETVIEKIQDVPTGIELLHDESVIIHQREMAYCHALGRHGNTLLPAQANVLTICNTGDLATAGSGGTALGVIVTASKKKDIKVFACETRPLLQGARLTTWELMKRGINVTLITDSMAAAIMKTKKIDCVLTGADRIAINGDTANKIGTYSLAVLAHYHQIPFYVMAPSSTFDKTITDGSQIPIEERNPDEVREVFGVAIAPRDVQVWNPSFDVTPHELISAIITEKGIHKSPYSF